MTRNMDVDLGSRTRTLASLQQFAGGQVSDEAAVGGEEFVLGEFFELDPFELMEDFVFEFAFE